MKQPPDGSLIPLTPKPFIGSRSLMVTTDAEPISFPVRVSWPAKPEPTFMPVLIMHCVVPMPLYGAN